tara:strand:+ start:4011 stop:4748 length:738 start_codon:yes stop_codon:yes gene_type:complete
MPLWNNTNIATDLKNYVRIIKKYDVHSLFNVDCLLEVADKLPDVAHCEIDDIEIEFYNRQPIAKTLPKIKTFKISLISSLTSIPDIDVTKRDPIDDCSFDLVITGFCSLEDNKEYINCWHLDKDIRKDENGKPNKEAKYTHPLYHFQFGGNHLSDIKSEGSILLMGAPRIPHPPMDIFLAIHFVLNNYFNKKEANYACLKELYNDDDYQAILERAKKRMWYPYFKGLSLSDNEELNLANLFPLAV